MAAKLRKRTTRQRGRELELVPSGIRLGSEVVPLFAGSVHYWRLEHGNWRAALEAVKTLGLRLVDTYVPWSVHERAVGEYDFGEHDRRHDIVAFLELARELGLYAIVRPGPHVNAELTQFGIPARVVWDPACQARSPAGKPVVLPVPPLAFPVPSYASEAFHAEVAHWFKAVGARLSPLVWPRGPIVLLQVDNEGSMYFRDGVYDQDFHPDAIKRYRIFLRQKYETLPALREAHGDSAASFTELEPPRRLEVKFARDLVRHLDWAEFQEELLAQALSRMREALVASGLGGLPVTHNLPLSEGVTPLDPERVSRAVDLVGLDYYHGASVPQRSEVARRTSELSTRARSHEIPAFACELGAGFPPFYPPLTDGDNAFTALAALAYGLRGFNLYMAVERDRWIGAPIDRKGRRRPSADFWERLVRALERTRFAELTRDTPVSIVVPRSLRRLSRVLHAFGPLSPALFHVLGGGSEEACLEDELELGAPVVIETSRLLKRMERELDARRIPYAVVGGDLAPFVIERGRWTILLSSGVLEQEMLESLAGALERGQAVSLLCRGAERDAALRPLDARVLLEPRGKSKVAFLLGSDESRLGALLDQALAELRIGALVAEPHELYVTVHSDAVGKPRVAFAINPSERDLDARLELGTDSAATVIDAVDALDGEPIHARQGGLELRVARRSVRMLELVSAARGAT